jgi:hypothetical protein
MHIDTKLIGYNESLQGKRSNCQPIQMTKKLLWSSKFNTDLEIITFIVTKTMMART